MNGATVSVQADGNGGEDRRSVTVAMAVERLFDMLEAGLHSDTAAGQESELRRVPRESFQRGEAVGRGQLADGIHSRMKVEWRQPQASIADFGNALPDFTPDLRKRVGSHGLMPPD